MVRKHLLGLGGCLLDSLLRSLCLLRDLFLRLLHLRGVGDVSRKLALDRFLLHFRPLGHRLHLGFLQIRVGVLAVFLFFLLVEAVVVDLLLLGSQGSILLLQLQRLDHVFTAVEPEHQVIAGRQTFLDMIRLDLELCKLVDPSLVVLLLKILLQDVDLLIQGRASSLIDLVLQDIPVVVMRGCLHILGVVLDRLVKLAQMDRTFHQPVQNGSPQRASAVRAKQEDLAVLVALHGLIDLAHHYKSLHIADSLPVDRIRHPRGLRVILIRDQSADLIQFFLILSLIHNVTPDILAAGFISITPTLVTFSSVSGHSESLIQQSLICFSGSVPCLAAAGKQASLLPGMHREQYKYREDLQSSGDHIKDQHAG